MKRIYISVILMILAVANTFAQNESVIDVKPYVETALNDFICRKDAALTNVFSILIQTHKIDNSDVLGKLIGARGYFQDGVKICQYFFSKSDPKHFKRRYSSVKKLPKRINCRK